MMLPERFSTLPMYVDEEGLFLWGTSRDIYFSYRQQRNLGSFQFAYRTSYGRDACVSDPAGSGNRPHRRCYEDGWRYR